MSTGVGGNGCPVVELVCTEEGHELEGQVVCTSLTPTEECQCFTEVIGAHQPDGFAERRHVTYCVVNPSITVSQPPRGVSDDLYEYVSGLPYCATSTQHTVGADACHIPGQVQPLVIDGASLEFTPALHSISQLQEGETEQRNKLSLDKLYPNPSRTNGEIRIDLDLNYAQKLNIRVHDTNGSTLIQMVQSPEAGKSTIIIPVRGDFRPGIYFVSVITSMGERETLRFVIVD
jgi:hypothetical protein